jgi:hypothetical protein
MQAAQHIPNWSTSQLMNTWKVLTWTEEAKGRMIVSHCADIDEDILGGVRATIAGMYPHLALPVRATFFRAESVSLEVLS